MGVHAEGVIYGWIDEPPGSQNPTRIYLFADGLALGIAAVQAPGPGTQAVFALIPAIKLLAKVNPGGLLHAYFDAEQTHELENSPIPLDDASLQCLMGRAGTVHYQGFLSYLEEIRSDGLIYGWAFNPYQPDEILPIYLYAETIPLGRVETRIFRPDLYQAGLGDGRHGFGLPLRSRSPLLDRLSPDMSIHAYFDAGRRHELTNSPVKLPREILDPLYRSKPPLPTSSPPANDPQAQRYERLASHLDGISDDGHIYGWAMDPEHIYTPQPVYFYVESHSLGATEAKTFREDLRNIGIGNGHHGFIHDQWQWPETVEPQVGLHIHAYFDPERRYELYSSPLVLNQEAVNRLGWKLAITKDLLGKDLFHKHRLIRHTDAIPWIAFIAMVKDEDDIIFTTLCWHYCLGFRKFIVIENASTDKTRARLLLFQRRFPEAALIIVDDPITAHLQSEFTTGALRLACAIWPEVRWVFPVDADEFLCLEQPLNALLEAVPPTIDALIFPKSFYMPLRGEPPPDNHAPLFKAIGHRTPITMQSSKVAVRANPAYEINQGNHRISLPGGQAGAYLGAYPLGGHYREFRIRSLQHLRKKVINGGRAIQAANALGKPDIGGDHWRRWYADYLDQGEAYFLKLFHNDALHASEVIFDPLPTPPPFPTRP